MSQQKEQKKLYFTNVPVNKITFELNVYDKAKNENVKGFLNANSKGAKNLIENILNSKYKRAAIKSVEFMVGKDGKKTSVIEGFEFGKKGDVRNFNISLKSVRFKWPGKEKEHTTALNIYTVRDEKNGEKSFGKNEKQNEIIMKQIGAVLDAVEKNRKIFDKENPHVAEVRIGIDFVEKDGQTNAYIGYVGEAKDREKEQEGPNNQDESHFKQKEQQKKALEIKGAEEIPF